MRLNPSDGYRIPLITACLLFSLLVHAQADQNYSLRLISGSVTPEENVSAQQIESFSRNLDKFQGKTYLLIQFENILTKEQLQELKQLGIELLDYVPNKAYTAVVSSLDATTLNRYQARAILQLTPDQKMEPALSQGRFPSWATKSVGTIDVWLSHAKPFDREAVLTDLRLRNFDVLSVVYKETNVIAVRLSTVRLQELASLPYVEYIEAAHPEDKLLNNVSNLNARANILNAATTVGGRNLKGEGIVVGIGDNANPLHLDFTGRRINRAAAAYNFHGTHVHGTTGGAGLRKELYTGYAPKATLLSQVFSGILTNAPSYVTDHNMVITNNSYGNIVGECIHNGMYDASSRFLDQQAFSLPKLTNVFAAGNSATGSGFPVCSPYPVDYKTVLGSYQSSKNVLTVGNTWFDGQIFQQSSRGPVRDGRLKPEITAQGTLVISAATFAEYFRNTGTSMAAPGVSGGLALLYQRYRQLNSNTDPSNALIKALVCNTATDKGNIGPDYTYGFGWMNLLRAVLVMEAGQFVESSISTGGNNNFNITVPANTAKLNVMLYWNDPAAAAVTSQALVNDLDLTVTNGPTYLPWKLDTIPANVANPATTGADHINNIEQVTIDNPSAGTYTVNVIGTAVPVNAPQNYVVVYDIIPISTTITYPIGGEKFKPSDSLYVSWDSWGTAGTFTVGYSTDNGATWTDTIVAANLRQLKRYLPNVTTDQARVRVINNTTAASSVSNVFTILGTPTVTLSSTQCEGYFAINWTAVTGATDYEVMKLQGDEMVSQAIVPNTTTSYTFSGLSKDSVYWVTVRARLNGNPARRDTVVSRQPNDGSCAGTISDLDLKVDAMVSPVNSGRQFTSTSLSSAVTITMRIKNLDDAVTPGNINVSYTVNGGSPVNETIINPNIPAGGTQVHSFSTTVDMSATGTYVILVTATQTGDPVSANNSLSKTFKQLTNAAITLSPSFLDNIEAASSQTINTAQMGLDGLDRYDFVNSTIYGQLRTFINTGIAFSGSKAITLDANQFWAAGNTDSLTGTFNLSGYNASSSDIRLEFRYKNHGQVSNAANRVWIRGNDTQPWVQVYDLYANQHDADGTYKLSSSIQLSDSLLAYTQNFSSSFQVRWGQWGQLLAADNNSGAGYSFDDIRIYSVTDDIQLVSIDTPIVSSCNLSATTPVKVTVRNNSNAAIPASPGIDVRFRVNGGAWVTENMGGLAANTSVQYTFTATANLAATGTHLVETQVLYGTDSYLDNDTASVQLINSSLVSSFPYLENFETGNGSWYSGGKNISWEYGTPASYKITRAASGTRAWKTRIAGTYSDLEYSYLYSPCFNISGMSVPTLSFSVALDFEDCGAGFCDGAYVEYSADGKTWSRLGANGQGTNWYNKAYSGNHLWSVQNYTRWHVATIPLPTGLTQLRLRFVVRSDGSVNRDGMAVDDIHIYDNIYGIYDGPTMASPVNQNITGSSSWVDFTSGGKLVASVLSANSMGSTDVQAYINTAAVRFNSFQYYHDRNITIKPTTINLTDSATVRFYFLDSETERLMNASGCGNCYKPTMAYELGISKYSDPNDFYEDGVVENGLVTGGWSFINTSKIKMVPFDKGYYWEFKVKDFSEFWLNNGGFDNNQPLPLELLSFTAKKRNNDVLVEWKTASEYNIDRFEVQLAKGNSGYQQQQFMTIGTVNSRGNSTLEQNYLFTDVELNKNGVRYYRLKIYEHDGTISYSATRPVVFDTDDRWLVYPNPSNGIFQLSFQLQQGENIYVNVYDAAGKLVKQLNVFSTGFVQKLTIDLSDVKFVSGLYQLETRSGEIRKSFKLLKQ